MFKRIAATALAAAILVPLGAGVAQARPQDDFYSGNANRSNCTTTYSHDRGYLYVIEVERGGQTVKRTVRRLPTSSPYTLIETKDLGVRVVKTCTY